MSYLKRSGIVFVVVLCACGMAFPSPQAQTRIITQLLQPNVSGAFLGINMKDVAAEDLTRYKLSSERGVIVSSVVKGSPAETATIKEDDVILEFGGYPVWSATQFSRMVQETPAGRKVEIVISRDGKRINLSAKLESRRNPISADSGALVLPREGFGPGQRTFEFRVPDPPNVPRPEPIARKPRLGITIQPLTDQLGQFLGVPGKKGVLVASVLEGSASAGKLKSGDVIVSVDGKSVEGPDELNRIINQKSEGSVDLKVIRDKKEITVAVSLPVGDEKGYKL
jgi:serine protease Do